MTWLWSPPGFQYERVNNSLSFFWSALWLRFPRSCRATLYRLIIYLFSERVSSSNAYRFFGICYFKICDLPDEALVVEHVRTRTIIPVTKVFDLVWLPQGRWKPHKWLMVSSVLPGRPLSSASVDASPGPEQIDALCETLASWVDQLRALESPYHGRVCGFQRQCFRWPGWATDATNSKKLAPPFESVEALHEHSFLTFPVPELELEANQSLRADRERRAGTSYRVCLTHGDLVASNILVDEEMRLTGLVDWEHAGWLPEYWDAVSSSCADFGDGWKVITKRVFRGGRAYEAEVEWAGELHRYHANGPSP
ncbi:Mediator of RNA polymerase II transcription subunit 13 [Mycena chlorophos]|uniref:Mediator of RNA polymerase II transcription subunit 13 n=1 Tax=Mycena chlorophos TaxID=658473 RepID=A0A8H6S1D6_MYCCL|nr:Mediator of RNA polymerase II transcription subunit 13 [Mycena chlorophos]